MGPELSLNRDWSIGETTFAALCEDARAVSPRTIVEFGSGPSSVRLALAFPRARILSVDDSEEFGGAARELARKYGVADRLEVDVRPLEWQFHAGGLYQSYRRGSFPKEVDVVIVDGPPSATRRGREACLYQAHDALRIGGRVYLDDYRRIAERRIARNWMLAYPRAFKNWTLSVGHEMCVLEKTAHTAPPRFHPLVFADVAAANSRRAAGWIRRRVRVLRKGARNDKLGEPAP